MMIRFTVTGLRPIPADEILKSNARLYESFSKTVEMTYEHDSTNQLLAAVHQLDSFMQSCRKAGCKDVKAGPFEMI